MSNVKTLQRKARRSRRITSCKIETLFNYVRPCGTIRNNTMHRHFVRAWHSGNIDRATYYAQLHFAEYGVHFPTP